MRDIGFLRTMLSVLVALLMCSSPAMATFLDNPRTDTMRTELVEAPLTEGVEGSIGETTARNIRAPLGNTDHIAATGYNNQRKLLRDANNILYAVFSKNGEIHFTNSTDDGMSWTSTKKLSGDSVQSLYPSMAISGPFMYVVWEDGPNISFRRSSDLGVSWIPTTSLPPDIIDIDFVNHPRTPVVAADNLDLVIAWAGHDGGSGDYEIKQVTSSTNGTSMTPVTSITSSGLPSRYPSITANGTNFYMVYQEGTPGSRDIQFIKSINSGTNWNAPTNVSLNAGDSVSPCIVDWDTDLYLVWVDITAGNPEVLFKRSTDLGTNWDVNPQLISETPVNSKNPGIAVVNNSDIYVIWHDDFKHPHNDTYIRRYNSSSAQWETKFLSTDLDEGYSYMAVNPYVTQSRIEWIYVGGRQPTYSVYYNFHYVGDNSPPELTWTGEENYENAGLFPEAGGTTAHTYRFRVNYTDADNNEPKGLVRLLVDYNQDGRFDWYDGNENRPMSPINPGDDDYTDGKIYAYSMKFPGLGQDYKYRFFVRDSMHNLAMGVGAGSRDYPDINVEDTEPRLFWTNEKGYSADGVEPSTGTSSTDFVWHVSYFDEDNDPPYPGYPKVLIDLDNNSFYSPSENFNMTELDPEDAAYDDGKFYTFNRTLPFVRTYKYKFVTRDIWTIVNPATDKPSISHTGPTVTTINTPPGLDFLPDPGFDDGLDPDSGSTSRLFIFRINYTDAENNPPMDDYPKIGLDLDLSGAISNLEKFTMVEENGSDEVYTDGKLYRYETYFPDVGTYMYRFETRDIHGQQATGETTQIMTGPDITKLNDAPTLQFPQMTGYEEDGVHPDRGRSTTVFRFMAEYFDKNDDGPLSGYPRVWVDVDLDKDLAMDEVFIMVPVDPSDATYEDGKLYYYDLTLPSNGRYSYTFDAWDGFDGLATGPATNLIGGPDVGTNYNNAPILEWVGTEGYEGDGIDPDDGPNTATFLYKVLYTDLDNDPPESDYPKLYLDVNGNGDYNDSNERQTMMEEDGEDQSFTDGKVYIYETDLGTTSFTVAGLTYTYIIFVQDKRGTHAEGPATAKMFGPNITTGNSPPELVWAGDTNYEGDGLHPETGNATQQFVYRVKYIDADNDPPSVGNPKVFINLMGKTMEKEDPTDDDHTDGVTYVYRTTLALGSHDYRFQTFDIYGTMADKDDAPMKNKDGPLVEENEAPTLSWTPDGNYPKGIDKSTGDLGYRFSFKVVYADPEADKPAPSYPRLLIDRNDDGDFDDPLEKLTLMRDSGTNYEAGVTFSIEMILEEGKHSYKFEALDAKGNLATGEATELQEAGVKVKAKEVQTGGDMTIYIILIVLIIVAAIVGVVLGRKMGGSKPTTTPPATEEAQPQAYDQAYYHEGYGYVQDTGTQPPPPTGPQPEPAPPVKEAPPPKPPAPPSPKKQAAPPPRPEQPSPAPPARPPAEPSSQPLSQPPPQPPPQPQHQPPPKPKPERP